MVSGQRKLKKQELDYEDEMLRKQIADAHASLARCLKGLPVRKTKQGIRLEEEEERSDFDKHGFAAGSAGAAGAAMPAKTENAARTDSDLPADAHYRLARCLKGLPVRKTKQGIRLEEEEKRSDLDKRGFAAGSAGAAGAAVPAKTENAARTDSDLPDWLKLSSLEARVTRTKDGLSSGQGSSAEGNEESSGEEKQDDQMRREDSHMDSEEEDENEASIEGEKELLRQDSDMDSEEEDEKAASSEEEQEELQELAEDENDASPEDVHTNGDINWEKLIALEDYMSSRSQRPRKQKQKLDCEPEVYIGLCDDAEEKADQEEEEHGLEQFWRDWDMVRSCRRQEKPEEECLHAYIFMDDIGRVCELCGKVAQLVTETFDLPVALKKSSTRSVKKRKFDEDDDDAVADAHQGGGDKEEANEVELSPHPVHEKIMHDHQKKGFRFLSDNLLGQNPGGAILAHAPGTGKTFLVVSFLHSYFREFPSARAIVVAPKNMLEPWHREFKKWQVAAEIPVYILPSGEAARVDTAKKWHEGTGVLLVTPQLLSLLVSPQQKTSFLREVLLEDADVLVVDEAHFARNENTKRFESLRKVKTRRRIFLSGTLFQNTIEELFNLFKLCRPNFLLHCPEFLQSAEFHRQHKAKSTLEKLFFKEIEEKIMEGENSADIVAAVDLFRKLTASFVHYYGGRVLESLPGLREFVVEVNLSEAHAKKVTEMDRQQHFIAEDIKLARACVHPCLAVNEHIVNQNPWEGVKTAFVMELVHSMQRSKEKVIVFSQFLEPLNLLRNMFKEQRVWSWSENREILYMDGECSDEYRQRVTDEFNSKTSKARVLLASIKACGEGISLVGGSRVVILDVAWNPSVVRQAVSRAFRIGQTRKVFVYRLLANAEVKKHFQSMRKEVLAKALLDSEFNVQRLVSCLSRGRDSVCSAVEDPEDWFLREFLDRQEFGNRCTQIYEIANL